MKKLSLCAASLLLVVCSTTFADMKDHQGSMNKVSMTLQSEQWAKTDTANVTVNVDAAVNQAGLDQIYSNTLSQLKQIADTDWHVVTFDRSNDSTGLERVQITAQARIPSNQLTALRNNADKISKAGQKFTIGNIDFVPSQQEIQTAQSQVRNNLYKQAQSELQQLNQAFPDAHYVVHRISFFAPGEMPPSPRLMMMKGNAMAMSSPAPLQTSEKIIMNARVVFASKLAEQK